MLTDRIRMIHNKTLAGTMKKDISDQYNLDYNIVVKKYQQMAIIDLAQLLQKPGVSGLKDPATQKKR